MRRTRTRKKNAAARAAFVRRLQKVRGGRSQAQFARDVGVFQQNVNRYEHGTLPHVDFLITLASKENVSIDWLLLGKGTRELH